MRPEKNCDGCGAGIRAEAKFCPYCGTKATPPAAGIEHTTRAEPKVPTASPTEATVDAEPAAPVTAPAVNGHASETIVIPPADAAPAGAESATTQSFTRPPGAAPPPPPNNGHPNAQWQPPSVRQAPPPWRPPPGPPPARTHAVPPAAARDGAVPGLLWPVIAMFGLAGVLTFVLFVFKLVGAAHRFRSLGGFFGAALLLQAIAFAAFVAACITIARLLYTGSRLAPGASCVAAGAAVLNLVFVWHYSIGTEVGVVLITLGLIAAACLVTLVPDLRADFVTPARNPEQPASITLVQLLLIALGSLAAFDALVYFVRIGVVFSIARIVSTVLAGLLALATAALAFSAIRGMLRGTGQGRVLVSVSAGFALLTVLVGTSNRATFLLMLGLAAGAVCFAWLPDDIRAHFGEAPLRIGTSAGAPAAEAGPVNLSKPSAPSGSAPGTGPPWQAYGAQQPPYSYAPPPGSPDERNMSMLAHLLGILIGWIGPLIIMLTRGKESPTVRANSVEALNFQLTAIIGYVAAWIVIFIATAVLPPGGLLVVLFLLVVLLGGIWVVAMVFMIVGCVRANRGEQYRYPVNIRMVR